MREIRTSGLMTGTPIDIKADLMVIDVSAGSTATTYPTYFYSDVDIGRFNCDPYKTNKIAMRLINKGTFTIGENYLMGTVPQFAAGFKQECAESGARSDLELLRDFKRPDWHLDQRLRRSRQR